MAAQPEAIPTPAPVRAEFRYIINTGVKPQTFISPIQTGKPSRREDTVDYREMEVHDAWPLAGETSLDREGFELHRLSSAVADYHDDAEVEHVHYPEIVKLIMDATGAARVFIFDHTLRAAGEKRTGVRDPVQSVHNDYTPKSGPQRVRDLFPDEAEELLGRRFAIINAWHSIDGRIESWPLAICDARSIASQDLVATDLVYEDRVGEVFNLAHGDGHRWNFFPRMEQDQVLLFKCFDSATDGRARFTAHSSFDDPASGPDARPRASIELRALVFFD